MRILYPSVSRHSPSSPPTFFILSSHHTNSYGHKMEREGASEVKLDRAPWSGVPFLTLDICPLLMIDSRSDMTLLVPLGPVYCFCHPKPAPPPALPHTLAQHTIRNTDWANLLVLPTMASIIRNHKYHKWPLFRECAVDLMPQTHSSTSTSTSLFRESRP